MLSIDEQIKICSKHHLNIGDAMKLMSASREKLKPVWERMVLEYTKQVNDPMVVNWGVPTKFVLDYFGIDFDLLLKISDAQKKEVHDRHHEPTNKE